MATPAFQRPLPSARGRSTWPPSRTAPRVVAFSSQYDAQSRTARKLLDFSTGTAWHSAGRANTTKWIKFSLAGGRTYQIDRFLLLGRQDCCSDQHPRDFEIAVSTTGTADADFKTVVRATLPAEPDRRSRCSCCRGPCLAKLRPLPGAEQPRLHGRHHRGAARRCPARRTAPTVTFDNLTVGGVAPLTYAWTFGDGGVSSEPSPTHTFPGPGLLRRDPHRHRRRPAPRRPTRSSSAS